MEISMMQVICTCKSFCDTPDPQSRDREAVKCDLARGYISEAAAREKYGLNPGEISKVLDAVRRGETG